MCLLHKTRRWESATRRQLLDSLPLRTLFGGLLFSRKILGMLLSVRSVEMMLLLLLVACLSFEF